MTKQLARCRVTILRPSQMPRRLTPSASAKEVWPWLVQMGQGRGGFYSWLENLIGCQIKNANEIVPEWQHLEVGDPIALHPKAHD